MSNGVNTGISTGRARLVSDVAGLTTVFNGSIFSNRDVEIGWGVAVLAGGNGQVKAYNNFYSNAALNLLSTLGATLTYRGAYVPEPGHSHGLIPLPRGVHFSNGIHGAQDLTIAQRPYPHPNYAALKADPRTVIVNAQNVPFGSWDSATNTWVYSGILKFPVSPTVIYYVDGNARLSSIYLSGGSTSSIITRGSLAIGQIGVLFPGVSLSGTVNVAVGPAGAAASVVANVAIGSVQTLHLLAEKDLVLGRSDILSITASSATETNTLSALAYANAGLSLTTGLLNIASTTNILAWSDTSTAWVLASGLDLAATTRANVCANGDATLAFRSSVASTVVPYTPTSF
jgi:hypothetical protein